MVDKLQELTDKLYNEGLSKGKQEAEELLIKAKKEAQSIIEASKEEAEQIIKNANKECVDLKNKAEGDIKIASVQTLSSVKQKLEDAISFKAVSQPITNALGEKEFLQSIIKTVVEAFNPKESGKGLDIILPENKKEEIDSYIKGQISTICKNGLDVSYSREIQNGFKISQKGDGYFIEFTDNSFEKIISEYIRPKTRKLIFGE